MILNNTMPNQRCKKCGRIMGIKEHSCPTSAWNKGLPNTWYNPKGLEIGRGFFKGKSNSKISGENHYLWNPDREYVLSNANRNTVEHVWWSRKVKNRDGKKCKINNLDCLGRLEAHHILSWRDHPELRYDINNGITLCHFHHPRKASVEKEMADYFRELITPASSPTKISCTVDKIVNN